MSGKWGRVLDTLFDNYVFVLLILAQAALTQFGVANALSTGMVGILLCAAGLGLRRSARIDPWIAVPMAAYLALGMTSSYVTSGNTVQGYPSTHVIFLTVYFLMACMDGGELRLLKRLNALWAGCAAAVSLGMFLLQALSGTAGRLGGLLHNPNALGIFLAVGWFAITACLEEGGEEDALSRVLRHLEPLVLATLALTLSMGSFVAMAAGILVLLTGKRKEAAGGSAPGPWKETFRYGSRLLAKASLGVGTGMLLYLAAARTGVPGSCLLILGYLLALAYYWKPVDRFLEASPRTAAVMALGGVLVAAAAVLVRPSAAATFAERLEMMRNGLSYLARAPVLGVGPFRWRALNLADSDKYFNTWHIHNVLLHVGVELGWISMAMLALAAARACIKRHDRSLKAELAAFCTHSLMDTGFFYLGITSLALLTIGEPGQGGKQTGGLVLKALFGIFALIYGYAWYLSMGVKGG